ncbi:DUF1906 domain-containing protein [Mycetocola lacteus]|uniref:DUF1906 domain-containing protein n=1 Tax=Mycetocola lacteus TaxID=76637 RepID=A0A3L7AM58_9MICO|nr:glycoside hydrolase domain-containing protein [Mycetocola lacteus]RLP80820.1 DUF1906 domain-containing protein [Mycetocola lacteus]RLP84605.1 DUF1906 domain-containing protein [Mycetocola lacteus]
MADPLVRAAQLYLNSTYSGRPGYVDAPTDGNTGWPTMFSLIRALQIELGVAGPSNTFGPGTEAAFTNSIGLLSSMSSNRKVVAILQCALWCKGYSGGDIGSAWGSTLTASVSMVRNNLGLTADPVAVNAKIMKSLLTMDAYVLLSGGSNAIRAGQQTLNRRYSFRKDFYIVPCDGLFTRQMQQGLMYALQYELGMADGVATGNFGPGTIAGIKANAQVKLGDADGLKNFVSLFQLALSCNGYSTPISGTFDAATRSQVIAFQTFMEIGVTGFADYGTWAALLVSTGDPSRPVTGMDTIDRLTEDRVNKLVAKGYRVAGRYLTVDQKSIKAGELENILDHGMSVVPIFQNFNNASRFFTEELGFSDAKQAAIRSRQLGFLDNVIIFFAVDYDATGAEASSIVLNYFRGVQRGLKVSRAVTYQVGIYGTRNVAATVYDAGLATGVWVSGMSTGYSGNLGFKMPSEWMYNQIQEIPNPPIPTAPTAESNIDRNVVSKRARPATRNDVARVPLVYAPGQGELGWSFHQLSWQLTKVLVLAEEAMGFPQTEPNNSFGTYIVLRYLIAETYNSIEWIGYLLLLEPSTGTGQLPFITDTLLKLQESAGALEPLRTAYGPNTDLPHMAATALGVMTWGTHEGQYGVGFGDLGGWALDCAQLWAQCCLSRGQQSIGDWVRANMGLQESSGFGRADVIGDADGWLLGRYISLGKRLDQAMNEVFTLYPSEAARIGAFISQRFGANTHQRILTAVKSVFEDTAVWIKLPRVKFMKGQRDPNALELTEFATAVADRFTAMATE